ncbi:hypothetical protein IAD21_03614 [Abditibacteriota bacterium]|nr:hypothetical protein IAD21_03614 [Abditibacteriota bacterium]
METLRLAEWQSKKPLTVWPADVQLQIEELARSWKETHNLNAMPLEWGGRDGQTLSARQWVGVIEVGDYRVEIYPKLDQYLLDAKGVDDANDGILDSSLKALLSMIAAADYGDWVGNERAALEYEPLQFPDVWAYFLGRHLGHELRRGLAHSYVAHEDDLRQIRGRLRVAHQVGRHFGRADVLACAWDEWSSDNALNRLFKCACGWLQERVSHSRSRSLLSECLWALDEVQNTSPREALGATERFAFHRANARFSHSFDFARRLLQSQSPDFGARSHSSWVFLTDMNALFERFCARAIEAKTGMPIREGETIGTLFVKPRKQIEQKPDFQWFANDKWYLGDAKWKLLGQTPPSFSEDNSPSVGSSKAKVSPEDARQLTLYSELLKRNKNLDEAPDVTLFYPTLGTYAEPQTRQTWNGGNLILQPVRVRDFRDIDDVLLSP